MSQWKYTIPVTRYEEKEDGFWLYGEASGPERDMHGSEMDPAAIEDFARQIRDRVEAGDPLPYVDNHVKVGVLRELGQVMEGSVTAAGHLFIGVRLDSANAASQYVHAKLKEGKQYGMSISGDGVDYKIVKDSLGKRVIRFMRVVLSEISLTTKPSWVPSFGTVLARAIDGEQGDFDMTDNLDRDEAQETEDTSTDETPTGDVALSEPTSDTEPVTAETEDGVERVEQEAEATEPTEDVERARISKKDADALLSSYRAMGANLAALGIDTAAPDVTPENTEPAQAEPVENSDAGDEYVDFGGVRVERAMAEALTGLIERTVATAVEPLQKTVEEQAAYIETLEKMPPGKFPAGVVRSEADQAGRPNLDGMSNEQKMAFALKALYE
jgi:hypothetical protein